MGLVRPEDRRFKEMTDPIYCGMDRAIHWYHKKARAEAPCNILTGTPTDDDSPFPIRTVGVRSEWLPYEEGLASKPRLPRLPSVSNGGDLARRCSPAMKTIEESKHEERLSSHSAMKPLSAA